MNIFKLRFLSKISLILSIACISFNGYAYQFMVNPPGPGSQFYPGDLVNVGWNNVINTSTDKAIKYRVQAVFSGKLKGSPAPVSVLLYDQTFSCPTAAPCGNLPHATAFTIPCQYESGSISVYVTGTYSTYNPLERTGNTNILTGSANAAESDPLEGTPIHRYLVNQTASTSIVVVPEALVVPPKPDQKIFCSVPEGNILTLSVDEQYSNAEWSYIKNGVMTPYANGYEITIDLDGDWGFDPQKGWSQLFWVSYVRSSSCTETHSERSPFLAVVLPDIPIIEASVKLTPDPPTFAPCTVAGTFYDLEMDISAYTDLLVELSNGLQPIYEMTFDVESRWEPYNFITHLTINGVKVERVCNSNVGTIMDCKDYYNTLIVNVGIGPKNNPPYPITGIFQSCDFTSDPFRHVRICNELGVRLKPGELQASQEQTTFNLFPNPANGMISLDFTEGSKPSMLYIYNNLGEAVLSEQVNNYNHAVNTSHLPAGIYSCVVTFEDQHKTNKLFTITNH